MKTLVCANALFAGAGTPGGVADDIGVMLPGGGAVAKGAGVGVTVGAIVVLSRRRRGGSVAEVAIEGSAAAGGGVRSCDVSAVAGRPPFRICGVTVTMSSLRALVVPTS